MCVANTVPEEGVFAFVREWNLKRQKSKYLSSTRSASSRVAEQNAPKSACKQQRKRKAKVRLQMDMQIQMHKGTTTQTQARKHTNTLIDPTHRHTAVEPEPAKRLLNDHDNVCGVVWEVIQRRTQRPNHSEQRRDAGGGDKEGEGKKKKKKGKQQKRQDCVSTATHPAHAPESRREGQHPARPQLCLPLCLSASIHLSLRGVQRAHNLLPDFPRTRCDDSANTRTHTHTHARTQIMTQAEDEPVCARHTLHFHATTTTTSHHHHPITPADLEGVISCKESAARDVPSPNRFTCARTRSCRYAR